MGRQQGRLLAAAALILCGVAFVAVAVLDLSQDSAVPISRLEANVLSYTAAPMYTGVVPSVRQALFFKRVACSCGFRKLNFPGVVLECRWSGIRCRDAGWEALEFSLLICGMFFRSSRNWRSSRPALKTCETHTHRDLQLAVGTGHSVTSKRTREAQKVET
eukprot:2470521-Rhodomonas_salina.1